MSISFQAGWPVLCQFRVDPSLTQLSFESCSCRPILCSVHVVFHVGLWIFSLTNFNDFVIKIHFGEAYLCEAHVGNAVLNISIPRRLPNFKDGPRAIRGAAMDTPQLCLRSSKFSIFFLVVCFGYPFLKIWIPLRK